MKKYMAFALAFLLIATLFTACGRGNVSKEPNGMIKDSITNETTMPVNPLPTMTIPSETTEETSETTQPSTPDDSTSPTLADSVNPSDPKQPRS